MMPMLSFGCTTGRESDAAGPAPLHGSGGSTGADAVGAAVASAAEASVRCVRPQVRRGLPEGLLPARGRRQRAERGAAYGPGRTTPADEGGPKPSVPGACADVDAEQSARCCDHAAQWNQFQREGRDIVAFLHEAVPLQPRGGRHLGNCLFCPEAPAYSSSGLCYLHSGNLVKWRAFQRRAGRSEDYERWAAQQRPFPNFGACRAPSCPEQAAHYVRLCPYHWLNYIRDKRPGGARAIHTRASRTTGKPV
jgi:hypothetical protein